jgi:hypothetical protein
MVPEPQTIAALVNLAADLSCQLNAIIELIKVQMHGQIAVQVPVAVPYDTEEGRVIEHLKDLRSAIAALNQVPEPALEPVPEPVAEPALEPEEVPEHVAEPVEEVPEPVIEHVAEPVEEVPEPVIEHVAEPVEEVPEEDVESVSDSEEEDDYVDTYGQYGFDKWGKPLPPPEEEDEPAPYGLDEQGRPYKHQPKSFDDTCSLILEQYGFKADKKKGVESIKTVNSDVLWSLLPSKYRSLYWRTIEDPPHADPTELKEWQAMSPQEKFEARASRILGKWKGSGPQFRAHDEILETTLERYDTVEKYDNEVKGPPMVRCKCCRDIFNTFMVTFHTCAK